MEKTISVAIAGVGNCASSLLQGLSFYYHKKLDNIGLSSREIGGYDVSTIKVVAAFDIDRRKVGKRLNEAIFADPNVAEIFERNLIRNHVIVHPAPLLDGMSEEMEKYPIEKRFWPIDNYSIVKKKDIVQELKKHKPDFLICYLPVGSYKAVRFYAECSLAANVSFINAMPEEIGTDPLWIRKFEKKKLLLLGDDIKSQVGSTLIHRVVTEAFCERGCVIDKTYQINIGGNTDFLNMTNKKRLATKLKSKLRSVSVVNNNPSTQIYAGPADYIDFLHDNKIAYINMKGRGFGNRSISLDIKLSVEDSTNSAGTMIDLIRIAKLMHQQGRYGTIDELCAYSFKSPLKNYSDGYLFKWKKELIEQFNSGNS